MTNKPYIVRGTLPATPLFSAGQVYITPGAAFLLDKADKNVTEFLERHLHGDWGDVLCLEDQETNVRSLEVGSRLHSVYRVGEGELWIMTEADRSVTTLLIPSEY